MAEGSEKDPGLLFNVQSSGVASLRRITSTGHDELIYWKHWCNRYLLFGDLSINTCLLDTESEHGYNLH